MSTEIEGAPVELTSANSEVGTLSEEQKQELDKKALKESLQVFILMIRELKKNPVSRKGFYRSLISALTKDMFSDNIKLKSTHEQKASAQIATLLDAWLILVLQASERKVKLSNEIKGELNESERK